jgi:hypothetical protein
MLPDCLAAGLSSTLEEVEEAVVEVEERTGTLTDLAAAKRPTLEDVDRVPGCLRWYRRRVRPVLAALTEIARLRPALFIQQPVSIAGFRKVLGGGAVLVPLRSLVESHLPVLPSPLGFGPTRGSRAAAGRPHERVRAPPRRSCDSASTARKKGRDSRSKACKPKIKS